MQKGRWINGNFTFIGKPTAKQVVAWAKWLADNKLGVDVDGRLGYQC